MQPSIGSRPNDENKVEINKDISIDELFRLLDNYYNPILWVIAIIGGLGFFTLGFDAGIISSALINIPFRLSPIETALIVSAPAAIAGLAAILSGPLTDSLGRKYILILDAVIFIIGSIMGALSVNTLMLILSRALIGWGIGMDYAVSPVFITEFSPTKQRGRLNTLEHILLFFGTLASLLVGLLLSYSLPPTINWRWMFGVGAVPAFLLLILRTWLPETPRWLALRGKVDELRKTLERMKITFTGKIYIQGRNEIIKEGSYNSRAMIIVGFWVFFAIASGINVILYYGPYIWKYFGFTGSNAIFSSLVINTAGLIGYIFAFLTIDRKGVRWLSTLGFSGMLIGMAFVAVGGTIISTIIGLIITFLGMMLFQFSFQGLGNVEVVLLGTAFPTMRRGFGSGVGAAIAWWSSFLITTLFPIWLKYYGFVSFAVLESTIAFLGVIWTILLVPEIKDIPLEEINARYKKEKRN